MSYTHKSTVPLGNDKPEIMAGMWDKNATGYFFRKGQDAAVERPIAMLPVGAIVKIPRPVCFVFSKGKMELATDKKPDVSCGQNPEVLKRLKELQPARKGR